MHCLPRGLEVEVLIPDLTAYYKERNRPAVSRDFPLGSMQGNYTWDELNNRFDELLDQYPNIISMWKNNEDPHFPNGENTNEVLSRLLSFLRDLSKTFNQNHINSISIFTHNGVLRCLIGNFFQIEKKDWFKIFIPYAKPIEFLYLNGKYYPNISKNMLPKILKNIGFPT